MAFAQSLRPLPLVHPTVTAATRVMLPLRHHSLPPHLQQSHKLLRSTFLLSRRAKVSAELQASEDNKAADTFSQFKHVLLPITDRNPYLSDGTRQAAAATAALAKKYGADITVVVIDEKSKEDIPEHEAQLSSIRWHLSAGGFQEFGLMERMGEGKKPTAIIGEVADDLNLDLVVMSMEAIHSKHVDGNLLAEFIPCPVLLLPL
ncbi:uncharacterized protein LOC18436628 isoform X2 [Amborella trichopoda]|uniref:uncharacterized protein LOC18436628 isoform X2 n=1 Tax=Amborella trichopoda TaxID=13333 RepID=UPI0005D3F82A|nr:uncharacterized protein LOC18436628 isoform X2 [Amborella trichopoda]|eukprot:XP_011624312.1 uncharacterized protein LOC18436628 isoform X2 [Amborella trichopoda]